MKITCEKCSASYMVGDHIIGVKGRKVKCVKCSHTWFVSPLVAEEEVIQKSYRPETVLPFASRNYETNLPSVINAPAPLWLNILSIASIFLIIILTGIFFQSQLKTLPILSKVYSIMDVFPTDNVVLDNVSINASDDGIYKSIKIIGYLKNNSDEIRVMPYVQFSIYNSANKPILQHIARAKEESLNPGERKAISTTISKLNNSASILKIDIGNKLDLFVR